ncbi:hypothetical protein DEO72_LG2g1061 [Vigna unguiculata]|uniref:Uncharacterized protein n=1 Tax=Vigna unguiculata TaxID=3917 RepID=A0A4D6KYI5_VIGUN|nr:hypothetical protein DEO72_LG2g1061 [Vigna unguiculata]
MNRVDNALLGLLTALGQASSKLSSSSQVHFSNLVPFCAAVPVLRSAIRAAGSVGLRVETRY